MNQIFFVTGIGTGVGKTLASAVLCEALGAAYWKPVQAGLDDGTDTTRIQSLSAASLRIFPEAYRLAMPASPHLAARAENTEIDLATIVGACQDIRKVYDGPLVVEGAGGLMVPLNDTQFMTGLAMALHSRVVIVSRNYLGSINHSLLTADKCKQAGLNVAGWIFNDHYMDYEAEIVQWSGYPALFSLPPLETISREVVAREAARVRPLVAGLKD